MKEFAYKRDDIVARCNKESTIFAIKSGPVLLTDFAGVESPQEAKERIKATIDPLFPTAELPFGYKSQVYETTSTYKSCELFLFAELSSD